MILISTVQGGSVAAVIIHTTGMRVVLIHLDGVIIRRAMIGRDSMIVADTTAACIEVVRAGRISWIQ